MDTIPGENTAMTAAESGELPIAIILTHVAVTIGFVALGLYDISKQRRADLTPADPELVGSASGAYGVPRTMLGVARLFWFCFGVFFVLYHLCYENILHKTDGMEYLSDWTFVLLGLVFGLLAWHSLAPASAGPKLTELTVVLHGVCWSTNIVSTLGAWYSFFFFPQCASLEGVDNYPACYLEWYRLTEHGLNMLILFGDYAVGLVPVRRKDYGHSILFLSVYSLWTWYVWFRDGKCPYVMFDFNAGWSSVPWYAFSYAGVSAAFFLVQRLYAARDARRNGASGTLGGDGILPGHVKVKYDAVRDDGEDEYD